MSIALTVRVQSASRRNCAIRCLINRVVAGALAVFLMIAGCAQAQENPAAAEWRSYIEPMLPIGERVVAQMSGSDDPLLRQELYRQLFSGLSMAYVGLFLGDAQHPDFWPLVNQAYNALGPNPDNSYYLAPIEGSGTYKISGFRGTVHMVDFQIGTGLFFPRGIGPFLPNVANYDLDKFKINKDGSFEVILSGERPKGWKGNWWPLDPKATHVLVRQVAWDNLHEVDGRYAIERLDTPAIRPRQGAEQIAENLRTVSQWAENWTALGLKMPQRYAARGWVNKVDVHDLVSVGGFSTQKYIEGQFDIAPDEALIYETAVPKKCRYWNVQLTDMLWGAIDYLNRQTALNGHAAKLDKDGKFRAVISATDPGVPNWLDTAGYTQGGIVGRWTECDSAPQPVLSKVKLSALRQHLPADTPTVSAEERDARIRQIRKAAQLRRRW